MHIVKDVRMILPRVHGIGRYLSETLKIWQKQGISHRITLLTNNSQVLADQGFAEFYPIVEVKSRPFTPGEFFEIPGVVRNLKPDLYHAPSISAPLFKCAPTVVTIPDLTPLYFGGLFHKTYCRTVLRSAVAYSRAIITISEFVKNDVAEFYKCDRDKIFVTHLAVSPKNENSAGFNEIQLKLGIRKPYIFCLSNPKAHKNLTGLVDIYGLFRKRIKEKVILLIGSRSSRELLDKINSSPFREDIRLLEYIEDGFLRELYANSEMFVFPSLYEGFGLPPLEAMACGCPVVSSDRASLGEIVGTGGQLADPGDMEDFSDKMALLINRPELKALWIENGLRRAAEFSWEKCADETLKVYEKAVSGIEPH